MNVLVIGRGGREHAIVRQFAAAPSVDRVYAAPGNDGMTEAQCVKISETDFPALVRFAREQNVAFTFVGPEQPLSEGIVDYFEEQGLKAFGPSKAAAQIESSKAFAKELMLQYGIPTAAYAAFTDKDEAVRYIREKGAPIVIKADGLAAGKGVVVAMTEEEAVEAVTDMLEGGKFGTSGASVVIEEFLEGEEFSFMSFVCGGAIYPMPLSQDHKRAFDGDKGPNTGGMGAYSPVPQISEQVRQEAFDRIVRPAVEAMAREGRPFSGILYAGLILTADGPKVIEFNARFGDPETQVVLPRMTSDFGRFMEALLAGQPFEIEWSNRAMLGVVVAAEGYPDTPKKGQPLPELNGLAGVTVIHAGTRRTEGGYAGNGGRVLLISAEGAKLSDAAAAVYGALAAREWPGFFYRTDIGWRAMQLN